MLMSESGHVGTTSRLQLLFLPIQHKLTSFLSSLALMDPSDIAKQFTTFYYHTFDTDRLQLAPLYVRPSNKQNVIRVDLATLQRQGSMLTFERAQILGVTDIVEKLTVTVHLSTSSMDVDHFTVIAFRKGSTQRVDYRRATLYISRGPYRQRYWPFTGMRLDPHIYPSLRQTGRR